ncbi:YktB family protein [Carnobacterium gallinarum]|uniref:YktB family protein n=1 Tax=Carnobacterium gallinarum TaxID=2749 RepID=UPI00054F7550|nr:DUF1054 domain-containing protein [Carnobacterium gallinarum]
MNNTTFTQEDFDVFKIEGLENRMAAIREQIQPKFRELATMFAADLAVELNEEEPLFVHIAQHIRRTKNAPADTWCAIGGDKRGYKKYPHFQLGIYEDHLFIWLAFIDNPRYEKEMAQTLLQNQALFADIPEDYVVSLDHHFPTVTPIKEVDLEKGLTRWHDVKKAEFLIGREIWSDAAILADPNATQAFILTTYKTLLPIYQAAYTACLTD